MIRSSIPPKKVYWDYTDKGDQIYSSNEEITPIEFKNKFIDYNLDEYVWLIHYPTEDKKFYKYNTVDFLSNIVDGDDLSYINVKINIMKKAIIKILK